MEHKPSDATIFDGVPDDSKQEVMWISASALGSLMRCKFQFYGLYILRYKEPTNANLFFGLKFDDAMNYNYGHKKTAEKDLPEDDVKDYFRAQWDAEKDKVQEWEDDNPDELKEMGTKGIGIFYQEVIPSVKPAEVQPKLSLTFKNANVILNGRPDVIETNTQIIDNKTSRASKPETFINQSLQPPLYSILRDDGKGKPQEVRFDILVKTKKPKYQPLKTVVTQDSRNATLKVIANHVELIRAMKEKKNFPPDAFFRGGWECMYCSIATLCKKTWGLNIPESKISAKAAPLVPKKVWDEELKKLDSVPKKIDVAQIGSLSTPMKDALSALEKVIKKEAPKEDQEDFRNILV